MGCYAFILGAGETAEQVRALAVIAEDLSWVTHTCTWQLLTNCSYNPRRETLFSDFRGTRPTSVTHT